MATKAVATTKSDELLVTRDGVSLCLLLNRRAKTMRVIDFRSGPQPSKRKVVLETARREGIERVFTLVERDEVATWTRLGFARAGSIPGFYKRSDAWVLSSPVEGADDDPDKSGLRLAVTPPLDPSAQYEGQYQHARKLAKEWDAAPRAQVKVVPARDADVARALASASARALTRFESFGRDVERTYYQCTARGGFSLLIGVESQVCFDNAFIELLVSPRTEKEAALTTSAIAQLAALLEARHIVGAFAISAVGDLQLAAAFLSNGFRKTGVLNEHLLVGKQRVDAFLWSRKLAQPADG